MKIYPFNIVIHDNILDDGGGGGSGFGIGSCGSNSNFVVVVIRLRTVSQSVKTYK